MDENLRAAQESVRKMENSHEILIGWVQLGLVSFLGTLYLIAPKGFGDGNSLEPVPTVLAVYLPVVMGRLYLAYRHALTPPLLFLSIVADAALVTLLIAMFQLQYRQPFYLFLKAPTFLYYLIFIGLRCLRWDPKYVLTSGGVSIFFWAGLTLWARMEGAPVTRSYTAYLKGEGLLMGAEIDKMLVLAVVTGMLAYAVRRSRDLLHRAVRETQNRTVLCKFFGTKMAGAILSGEAVRPGQGAIRTGAVLSVDMRGFTPLSQSLTPNEVVALLSDFHDRVAGLIFEYGGCVDKYLGDGILAHFGMAQETPDSAAKAVSCLHAMGKCLEGWNAERASRSLPPIRLGFSATWGPALFGAIGNDEKVELTVIGETVNLSAKLEKHTKALGVNVLMTQTLWDQAAAQGFQWTGPVERFENATVPGVKGTVNLVGARWEDATRRAA